MEEKKFDKVNELQRNNYTLNNNKTLTPKPKLNLLERLRLP